MILNYLERNKLSTENFFYGKFCGKKSKNENLVINEDNYCYDNDNQTEKDEYERFRNNRKL